MFKVDPTFSKVAPNFSKSGPDQVSFQKWPRANRGKKHDIFLPCFGFISCYAFKKSIFQNQQATLNVSLQ